MPDSSPAPRSTRAPSATADDPLDAVHAMVVASPVGMALLDREARYVFINDRLAAMNGRPPAEHVGRTVREILGAAAAPIEAAIAHVFATGSAPVDREYEREVPPGSGRRRWLRGSYHPLCGPDGVPRHVSVFVVDATDQREAEKRLQASRNEFERLLDASPDVVARFDRALRHVYVNPAAEHATGIPRSAFVGRRHAELGMPPATVAQWEEALERVFVTAEPTRILFDFPGPDGTRWWECAVTPEHRGDDGAVATVLAVGRDVTEARRSLEELRRSEERLRLAASATQDVLYDYDVVAGRITWNEATPSVLRYPPEAIGSTIAWWSACIHPEDLPRIGATLAAALEGAAATWTEEYRFLRGDGTYATLLDRGHLQRDGAGRAIRMIGSMVDLTERHRLEEQLRQAQKMEAVGQLAGGVAHDFNNLLAAISINLRLLRDTLGTHHAAHDEIEQIGVVTERATQLTRQLLAFSRKQVLRPRLVDLNEVVRSVGRLLARVIGEHIVLALDLAPTLHPVLADPAQFEQVLMNLAVNARDAMPGGGTLRIATAEVAHGGAAGRTGPIPAGDYVALTVTDSGRGMSEATRLRIFEPFYTTKPAGKGTGLGLATVYGIVRQSGGHITVDSEPGSGTSFTILLPRASGVAPEEHAVVAEAAAPDWRGRESILLVEDQAALRNPLRRLLERHGYRVLEAQHGSDALALLEREGPVDLVITDVVMPEMGGRELIDLLARRGPVPPVLFMSGYDERAVRTDRSLPAGTGFLAKPFETEELLRLVRETLDRRG